MTKVFVVDKPLTKAQFWRLPTWQAVAALMLIGTMLACVMAGPDRDAGRAYIVVAVGRRASVVITYSTSDDYAKAVYRLRGGKSDDERLLAEGSPTDLVVSLTGAGRLSGFSLGGNDFSLFSSERREHTVFHNGKKTGLIALWRDLASRNRSFRIRQPWPDDVPEDR